MRIFPVLNVCGLLEKYPRLNSPLPAYLIVDSFHRLVKRGISGGARGEGGGGGGMGEREKDRFRFFIPFPLHPLSRSKEIWDGIVALQLVFSLSLSKFFPAR